ncbi:MAG: DUF5056 domain-containing protein [Bacteroides sp.]|uniref:DUF5056 domain-containing protein n=1 Tax=Bacteroides sp. TaxID=29523 RepID=UPI002FCA1737
MTETDDKLLRDFFAAEKKEIADNGFSRRVLRKLPHRVNRLTQAWAVFITLVAIALFFVCDGFQGIISTLRDVFVSIVQSSTTSIDPRSLLIAVIVLAFLGVRKAWAMVQ